MPNEDADRGDSEKTVSFNEYQKLQRKLERQTAKTRDTETRALATDAAVRRLEATLTGLSGIVGDADDELKTRTRQLSQDSSEQARADDSAAQLTTRLNQIIDDADEDWENTKFDSARRTLEDINRSGDLSRGYEVERLIKDALSEGGASTDENIETAIARAVLADRQEHNRVDTSGSSTSAKKYTREDLGKMDVHKIGVKAAREHLDAIYEQMGT